MISDDSLRLAAYHDNNIDNNNICSSAPLSVNIDDMPTLDVPCLEFDNLETLPVKMKLSNNGRTGIYTTLDYLLVHIIYHAYFTRRVLYIDIAS